MEKLTDKQERLLRCFAAFKRSVDLYNKCYKSASLAQQETYTASVIKHFELCYEPMWKFLKVYLLDVFGIDVSGSKTIFKACFEKRFINETELQQLLKLVDIRNMTTHVYEQVIAEKLCLDILQHIPALESLLNRFNKTK